MISKLRSLTITKIYKRKNKISIKQVKALQKKILKNKNAANFVCECVVFCCCFFFVAIVWSDIEVKEKQIS